MNINFRFYILSVVVFLILPFLGYFTGRSVFHSFIIGNLGKPSYGEEVLAFAFYTAVFSVLSFFIGFAVSLIVIHKLGKKWGPSLSFGSHPVLKLTFLSFLTFLGLLVLLLFLIPTK